MRSRIVPFEKSFITIDTIGKDDVGKTPAFLNEIHNVCSKKFNAYFNWLVTKGNRSERKRLEREKNKLFLDFYVRVNERIYQIISPATEDIKDDLKRGKKRIELQERIDVTNLVTGVPLPLSPLVKTIMERQAKRASVMTGKKIAKERMIWYKEMCKLLLKQKNRGEEENIAQASRVMKQNHRWTEKERANFARAFKKAGEVNI